MKNEIELVQLPIIKHQIQEIGKQITERIDSLNIENLVATVDTLQVLKTLRADLNKEYAGYEDQRKTIKKAIAAPYQEMELVYKEEIGEKITNAVSKLKDKIALVENTIKDEKKKELEVYFVELCQSESIDFLTFEQAKIKIDLSTSVTNLKKQANEFVLKVKDDLELIDSQEYKIEIIVEYKKTLNASKAITDIVARKEAERQARLKAEQKEWDRRKGELRNISMIYKPTLKIFEYNETILVFEDKVKAASNDDFTKMVQEYKTAISDYLESIKPKAEVPTGKPVKQPIKKPAPAIAKPVEVEKERITKFMVKATITQLRGLIKYMEENEITYEDL